MNLKLKNNNKLKLSTVPFTQLEYIESTGTQWIDTGIKSSDNSLTFKIGVSFLSGDNGVFGAGQNSRAAGTSTIFRNNSNNLAINWGTHTQDGSVLQLNYPLETLAEIEIKAGSLIKLNGNNTSVTAYNVSYSTGMTANFLLHAYQDAYDNTIRTCKIRTHYFIVYNNNEVEIIHLIPVVDSWGVVCMYDEVSGEFFYNQGTGSFIDGPETGIYMEGIDPSIITTAYIENCPNTNGYIILKSCPNLTRVRIDIGNIEGKLSDLLKFKDLGGFTDDLEDDFSDPNVLTEKPMLYGTYIIEDRIVPETLEYVQSCFPTLNLVAPNIIQWADMAVQTLDSSKPNYNPAVGIRLWNLGYGEITNNGRWFITKSDAAQLRNFTFYNMSQLTDTYGIVSDNKTKSYIFNSFDEFEYFTGIISIPGNMFSGCIFLKHIKVPLTVTTFSDACFYSCYRLEEINIPTQTTYFGNNCFFNCISIKNHTYSGTLSQWCEIRFQSAGSNPCFYDHKLIIENQEITELEIPDSVPSTISHTFAGTNITSAIISSGVTDLVGTFRECKNLSSIVLHDNIYHFGDYTFSNTKIDNITLPTELLSLGSYCFSECTNLTNISLNSKLNSIGAGCFYRCTNLRQIVIPNTVISIGSTAFRECSSISSFVYSGSIDEWCNISLADIWSNPCVDSGASFSCNTSDISTVTIPQNITTLGNLFSGVKEVKHLVFHNGITSFSSNCFYKSGLVELNIPDSVISLPNAADLIAYSDIRTLRIGAGITSIPNNCFRLAINLESVVISEGVVSAGLLSFSQCPKLVSAVLPNSLTSIPSSMFDGCSSLREVTIGNAVTSIGDRAFYSGNIRYLELPNTLTTLVNNSLSGVCAAHYEGPANLTEKYGSRFPIKSYKSSDGFLYEDNTCKTLYTAWQDFVNISIPEGVVSIYPEAFRGYNIEHVDFPSSLTTIGDSAFFGCSRLFNVEIPNTVTTLGSNCFHRVKHIYGSGLTTYGGGAICFNKYVDGDSVYSDSSKTELLVVNPNISSYTIDPSVTKIGSAFVDYTKFTSITIPSTVTSFTGNAFQDNKNITSVILPSTIKNFPSSVFQGCNNLEYYDFNGTLEDWFSIYFSGQYSSPTSITHKLIIGGSEINQLIIPLSVNKIPQYSFVGCGGIESIVFHEGIVNIEGSAFLNCTSIRNINLPSSLNTLGTNCFAGCSSLENVNMVTVSSIGNYAFQRCNKLRNIVWNNANIPVGTFRESGTDGDGITLEIPSGTATIGQDAFYMAKIDYIKIPSTVTSIGTTAFGSANIVGEIDYEGTLIDWLNITFGNSNANPLFASGGQNIKIGGEYFTDLTIPSDITSFKNYNYIYRLRADSIVFHNNFTSLGLEQTFFGNQNIKRIVFSDNTTNIPNECFRQCKLNMLEEVVFGSEVNSLGSYLFSNTNVKAIVCKATIPPACSNNSFGFSVYNPMVWVPDESVELYKQAAVWSNLASYIFPISEKNNY